MVTPNQGDICWVRFGHSVAKSILMEKIGTLSKEKLAQISGHQQSWRYEDGPWKGPRPSLLVAADFDGSLTVISQKVFV